MSKQKKGRSLIISILLLLILLFLAIVGYAWAKYSSTNNGNTNASVAKWSFKVNGSDENFSSFNLENTINSNDSVQEGKVAPGTSGYFDLNLDGRGSEVAINYIVNTTLENKPQNMHFYLDSNYNVELEVIDNHIIIDDFIPLSEINEVKNVRIYWDWPLETGNTEEEIFKNDLIDTESMNKTMLANVSVTGIQVPPESQDASFTVYHYLENANDSNFTLYATDTYSQNVSTELSLSNVAREITNATYGYGSLTAGGEHVLNCTISAEGTTKVYLYYYRDRFTLTTIAGPNIGEVRSTGLSTGTSNNTTIVTKNGTQTFEQPKQAMVTKYKYGETVTLTANTEPFAGYITTFSNWTTESTANLGNSYNSSNQTTSITMPTEDVTIMANGARTANTYTVEFNSNTGEGQMASQSFTYDVSQNLTASTFTKTGYTFAGWNTSSDGTGTNYSDEQNVSNLTTTANGTVTLYALWAPNEYYIIFNSNGGTGTMQNQAILYDELERLTENRFTKLGYTFTGWNTQADGQGDNYANKEQILNLSSIQGSEVTLYAQWDANSYIVEFNSNGGTGLMQNQNFTYDVAQNLRANAFSKPGYTFAGWTITENGTEIIYQNEQQVSNLTTGANGTVTLYAKWTANNYSITYNTNGGEGQMENTTCTFDEQVKLLTNAFTKTGYTFTNWNTARDGSGTTYENNANVQNLTTNVNGNVNLYAQWTANHYKIVFNSNTGTGDMSDQNCTYDIQSSLTQNTFTKTGYTFTSWNTQADGLGTSYNNEQQISNLVSQNNGSITLYAIWQANTNTPYTVKHYVMNTSGNYVESLVENLTGTTDSTIQINNLKKTTNTYNVTNGIYYKKATTVTSGDGTQGENNTTIGKTISNEETTILADGTLQINIYYARTYGFLTTAAGTNVTSVTTINNHKYYYGQSVPQITATTSYTQGYITTFEKWESSNNTEMADITDNPITNFTWPAMPEGTSITLTAKATKEVSNYTPYTVNYYLQNAEDDNYTLYRTSTLSGTTGATITQANIEISITGSTLSSTDLTPSTTISANGSTIVNAYYTRNQFTLTIEGGSDISEIEVDSQTDNLEPLSIVGQYRWGTDIDLDATLGSNSGYTYSFTGWTTSSEANLGIGYNGQNQSTTLTMPAENLTLTATASKTANSYTVIFNSNSGTGTMQSQSFAYGTAQNLTLNAFEKAGYTFKGWATTANGTVVYADGENVSNLTTKPNGTVNLYAVWADETPPAVSFTTTPTTHSIQVETTATDAGSGLAGTYKYYIGTEQTVEVQGVETTQVVYGSPVQNTNSTYTFEGLEDNIEYFIKVEIDDNNGNTGLATESETTNELLGEVTFSNQYWSNGKYILTLNTTATDEQSNVYQMQYGVLRAEDIENSKTFNESSDWENNTVQTGTVLGIGVIGNNTPPADAPNIILKDGDIVYARVYDGTNGAQTYTYSIVNNAVKTYTEQEMAAVSYGASTYDILTYETGTDSFKVDIEKEISGVETYNYYAKSNDEDQYKLISTSTNWSDQADISNALLDVLGKDELDSNQTYKVKVLTLDSNNNVTKCLNTATIITQANAAAGTTYAQNRTYIDSEKYTAIIPAGFSVSGTSGENTISSGMVLKDSNGNEFVWVPVNQAIAYSGAAGIIPTNASNGNSYYKPMSISQSGSSSNYEGIVYTYSGVKSYRNTSAGVGKSGYREPSLITNAADGYTWNVSSPTGTDFDANTTYYLETLGFSTVQEYGNYINKEYKNMVNSTNNFGGFYIGRYETSVNGDAVQSKSSQTPMSNVHWYQMYKNQDSNRNSNNPYYNMSSVTSSMIWGSQYDSMLNWIANGTEKSKLTANTYGNKTDSQTSTGQYSNDIVNNIYDLIANTYEWSLEAYNTNVRTYRGGTFNAAGTTNMTARGTVEKVSALGPAYGSRLALYINSAGDETSPSVRITGSEVTANSITVNAVGTDSGSGLASYTYSISEDEENWTSYTIFGTTYTFTGLSAESTYFVKVQATDKAGNVSAAAVTELVTEPALLEEGVIYIKGITGTNGNGIVQLGVREDYANQGYTIEYQIKVKDSSTANNANARYETFNVNNTWLSGDIVKGLYEEDIIYARLTDGINTTSYTTINVIGLETFSEIYSATTAYTDENNKTAYIPAGFSVGTSEKIKNIDDGLVIQDASGNQFVWVPVDKALSTGGDYPTSTSSTISTKPMAKTQSNSNNYYEALLYAYNTSAKTKSYVSTGYKLGTSSYREPSLITGSAYDGYTWDLESLTEILGTSYDNLESCYKTRAQFSSGTEFGKYMNEEFKNMIDSVEQYKGFYVARYETSLNGTTAQSQLDKALWDNSTTNWYDIYYYQDSNRYSSNPYYNSTSVTSSMIFGSQYDSMLNWLLKDNSSVMFDTTIGNHTTAVANSGQFMDDLTNNIFDLGGNLQEYIQEAYDTTSRVRRGGSFYKSSSYHGNCAMSYMGTWNSVNASTSYNFLGTRMALYLTKQGDTTAPTISLRGEPTNTTNSITLRVNASDENSGIEKYHYYISTDGTNYIEQAGWGNMHTFEGLTAGTTYYIKATVEDKAGNVSNETAVSTVTTTVLGAIDDILQTRIYGSGTDGHLYLGLLESYEEQGYYVQYQKNTLNLKGTWTKPATSTVTGLKIGDVIYARINDGNGNTTTYKTITISELETFGTAYLETSTYTDTNGDTATIPAGFSVGTSSSINTIQNGLVIQDSSGNQFVWVPVDSNTMVYDGRTVATNGTETYKPMVQYQNGYDENSANQYFESIRYDFNKTYDEGSKQAVVSSSKIGHQLGGSSYREPSLVTNTANYSWIHMSGNNYDVLSQYYHDILGFDSAEEFGQYMNNQYTQMVQSVKQYGGFYIGRYETCLSGGVVGSRLNVDAMDSRAPTSSVKMGANRWYGEYLYQDSNRCSTNPYYNVESVTSSMIWGSQYDAMLNWVLEGNGADMVYKRRGNHSGGKNKTGTWGVDVMNNIFDLSANCYEWTQEVYSTNYRVLRGGGYDATNTNVASSRNGSTPPYQNANYGSRLVLCIRSSEP